jgi:hypothetical protein
LVIQILVQIQAPAPSCVTPTFTQQQII